MFAKSKKIERQYFGKDIKDFMELPDLIDIQLSSYESFIQRKKIENHEPLERQVLKTFSSQHSQSKVQMVT